MQQFVSYFEHLSSLDKFIWIAGSMTLFWLLEGAFPLFKKPYSKWEHARTNLVLLATTILINLVFGLATAGVFIWLDQNQFGLLHLVDLALWIEMLLALLFLDFLAQYVVHYLLHKVSFLWRLHMTHHSDTMVDVTTGTRHHPGDFIFRETFALLAVIIGGMPLAFYMFYRICTIFFTYFSHANLKLPLWFDKGLSYVFISPNMHKFHHHFERPWTDSNFGNIFSIWDRIFGTFVYQNTNDIKYGLDVLKDEKSNDLTYQLGLPFDRSIKTDY